MTREEPSRMKVAFVMPVYNEAKTIVETVAEILDTVLSRMPNSSLHIFEDGSTDNTKDVLASLSKTQRIQISTNSARKGYPKAVRDAILSVNEELFDYVLFLDSDGQYDPSDFRKLFVTMSEEYPDIVIGRRSNRTEPMYRTALSSGLKTIEKVLFSPKCHDVTSALRLMRVDVAKKIASEVRYSPYNFWLEFTARAAEEGFRTTEVPVSYRARRGEGKSNVYSARKMPRIVFKELTALLHTWWDYKGHQLLRFASVGLTGAAVILAFSYAFISLMRQNYLLSTGTAIEISIIWAFFLNDHWTFGTMRKRFGWVARLARYNAISLAGLAVNLAMLFVLVRFGVYYLTAESLAIVFTFAFNYLASSRWAWTR